MLENSLYKDKKSVNSDTVYKQFAFKTTFCLTYSIVYKLNCDAFKS